MDWGAVIRPWAAVAGSYVLIVGLGHRIILGQIVAGNLGATGTVLSHVIVMSIWFFVVTWAVVGQLDRLTISTPTTREQSDSDDGDGGGRRRRRPDDGGTSSSAADALKGNR